MKGIAIVAKDPANRTEFTEVCDDITEYSRFVQKQTGLSGAELFDATKARYSKIGWAPWEQLTWQEAQADEPDG